MFLNQVNLLFSLFLKQLQQFSNQVLFVPSAVSGVIPPFFKMDSYDINSLEARCCKNLELSSWDVFFFACLTHSVFGISGFFFFLKQVSRWD